MQSDYAVDKEQTLAGQSYPVAGFLCLLGFFLHMVLSDPLLTALGWHYSAEEGKLYEKIHPGTMLIFISLAVLLLGSGNPLRQFLRIGREHKAFALLLLTDLLILFYIAARSGTGGIGFIIDTHMSVPACAIVLCYTPVSYCRRAVHLFIFIAAMNSLIGIAEAVGQFRIFTFDPSWIVLHEEYFRASALRGHPLNNAMFTAVALFTSIGMRYPHWLKAILIAVFMVSLVAFGGRAALLFCLFGLLALWIIAIKRQLSGGVSLLQLLFMLIVAMLVPLCLGGGLYLMIDSPMGERIATHMGWDASAESRELAFRVFHYMTGAEILFGISLERIINIVYRMNLDMKLSDIENPWVLMCMNLGVVAFCVWLAATLAFIYRLMKGVALPLQLAVIAYFIIASTSNSFGRKDSTYVIMAAAVICASRSLISSVKR